ncbi:MAG: MotA/TolQ/ExbB proton channel family protein [Deinococcales bacterium]
MSLILNGGPVLFAIILVSIYGLYLFLERLFRISRERLEVDKLMDEVNAAIDQRDIDLALNACENHGGPVARVLSYALSRLPYGRTAVEAAFEEAALEEEQHLTKGLRALATIAQIAPLLGLLGTVTGMIISFNEISRQGTGNPAALADGISQALITTAAGLIVAIPTLIGHNFLSGKVDTMLLEIERRREEFMGRVAQVVSSRRGQSSNSQNSTQFEDLGDRHEPLRPPQ